MMSGRVRTRWSLHPSSDFPPKSSGVGWKRWMFVPIAPSNTSTRWPIAARYEDGVGGTDDDGTAFGSDMTYCIKKRPQRKRCGRRLAECLTWPQVALNRHERIVLN